MDAPANVAEWLARYTGAPRARAKDSRTVPQVLRWLGQHDVEEHIECTVVDARRLLFVRWLLEHGRLSERCRMTESKGEPRVDIVHVRDVSSGRVHRRVRIAGSHQLASFEGDNADTAGAYSVLTDAELAEVERDDLCGRCFPKEGA